MRTEGEKRRDDLNVITERAITIDLFCGAKCGYGRNKDSDGKSACDTSFILTGSNAVKILVGRKGSQI